MGLKHLPLPLQFSPQTGSSQDSPLQPWKQSQAPVEEEHFPCLLQSFGQLILDSFVGFSVVVAIFVVVAIAVAVIVAVFVVVAVIVVVVVAFSVAVVIAIAVAAVVRVGVVDSMKDFVQFCPIEPSSHSQRFGPMHFPFLLQLFRHSGSEQSIPFHPSWHRHALGAMQLP